jgi:hypothetical protein
VKFLKRLQDDTHEDFMATVQFLANETEALHEQIAALNGHAIELLDRRSPETKGPIRVERRRRG